ncbi:MAG: redoxin family protein [Alphaproteobacteria bacterium]|nr:redoxin family protein [Alphaproteobacteria bacterium]
MTWSLLLAVASAGPSVESGWALYRVGDYGGASALAAGELEKDPSSMGWQRLYARSRARIDGDRAVIGQYRRWLADAPDDPGRRVLLADTLAGAWRFDAAWCDEIEQLLAVTPTDADTRFWTHAVRHWVRTRRCRGDADADAAQAIALSSEVDGGASLALPIAIEDGIDAGEAEWIRYALGEEPALLGRLVPVFEASGPGASKAQKAVLKAARDAMSGDLPALYAAAEVLEAAGDPRANEADARLAAIHPDPHRFGFAREISRARRHADPMRALAQVDALAPRLPDDPEVRARFHTARGDLLRKAGDLPGATAAYKAAWQATPEHAERANFFAYHATLSASDLEDALQAATAAVRGFQSERFDDRPWAGETFEEWRVRSAERVGEALDTRGWALHLLGRDADALPDLLQASRLVDVPVIDLHVGFVLTALGDPDAAAVHLARGTRERDPGELPTVERGWKALRAWWADAGLWHAGGLEGWVADVSGEPPPAAQLTDPSDLVGRTLPEVAVLVAGQPVVLSEVKGPAVVDVWATWCRPCIEALPEVERLAGKYPNVRFLAVSVDDKPTAVDAFFEGTQRPAVPLGWWNAEDSPYELLGIAGVPSLFVVDRDNRVAAYLLGADVNRLGAAVEAVARTAE